MRNSKLTVRSKILGTCIGSSMILRRGTSLDVIQLMYEKGNVVADSHSIVDRWRNYFSQVFNVHGFKDVGQTEIHTEEQLVPDPRASEFELAIEKLKCHKSPGIDQIPAELIKVGGGTLCLEIHKLITSIWEREKLPEEWKE